MILRCVCWSIFLCLALQPTVKSQVTIDDQGYQNVLISFESTVPSEDGKATIEEIQDILEKTSGVLRKAIGIPIASATFLLPSTWPTDTWKDITVNPATAMQTARRSDILVDATEDSPFVNQPVALQHGGCGVPGHQIILNLNFIGDPKYPEGKLLAREWLKYRYGVFEENGFRDDMLYPDFYKIPGKPEVRVTDCTNSKVTYTFKLLDSVCAMDSDGDFGSCTPYPDEKSAANVTSSLMYFNKDLTEMEHVCGKDGHPHDSIAPNKQNALCNGRSIWDVVKSSEDFKKIQQQPVDPVPKLIKFSYLKKRKQSGVARLENSDNLNEKNDVVIKLGSTEQLSILTQVQMTTQKEHDIVSDAWIHDLSTSTEQLPSIIYVKIYFGPYPVKYASVAAVVSLGNRTEIVKILDNGRGDPDVTQYDGIYSGYITNFLQPGNYQINLTINDDNGQAKIGKANKELVPEACCGSRLISKDHGDPAFQVNKLIVYNAKNKRPEDGYPPSRIVDLRARILKSSDKVYLLWTAPGGGKAVKYVIKLFESREDAIKNFDTGREFNSSSMVPKETGKTEAFVFHFRDLNENVTYYAAIRSSNEFNKQSKISNVEEFVPNHEEWIKVSSTTASTTDGGITKPDPPKSSNKTIEIVFGVLGGIAFLCIIAYLGYYFFVKKPRQN